MPVMSLRMTTGQNYQNYIERLHLNRSSLVQNRRQKARIDALLKDNSRAIIEKSQVVRERERLLRELELAHQEIVRLQAELDRP